MITASRFPTWSARALTLCVGIIAFSQAAGAQFIGVDSNRSGTFSHATKDYPDCMLRTPKNEIEKCVAPKPDASLEANARAAVHMRRAYDLSWIYEKTAEAAEQAEAAVQALPKSADTLHFAARMALFTSRGAEFTPALNLGHERAKAALEIRPDDPDIRNTLAQYAIRAIKLAEAFEIVSAILKDVPDNFDARSTRSDLYAGNGAFEQAADDLDYAIKLRADDFSLRLRRAYILVNLERPADAIPELDKALASREYKYMIEPRITRAALHRRLGNFDAAIKDLSFVIDGPGDGMKIAPMMPDQQGGVLLQRGMVYFKLGRTAEAMRDVEASLALHGVQRILKTQLFLRQHGYTKVKIDGKMTDTMRDSIIACFGAEKCGTVFVEKL